MSFYANLLRPRVVHRLDHEDDKQNIQGTLIGHTLTYVEMENGELSGGRTLTRLEYSGCQMKGHWTRS